MSNLKTPPVYKVIIAQLAVTVFIAVISLLISGTVLAYSALLGGLISALPNSYFALHAYRYQGARNAQNVVKGFVRGELGKIVMTVVLFALSFTDYQFKRISLNTWVHTDPFRRRSNVGVH